MGIPSYFRKICEQYAHVHFWNPNQKIDYFFIDFNCLMYPVIHEYLKNLSSTSTKSPSKRQLDDALIEAIIQYTRSLIVEKIRPQQMVYLALDGSAPMAKMVLQRSRRYKKILEQRIQKEVRMEVEHELDENKKDTKTKDRGDRKKPVEWNTNVITPGTRFMDRFCKRVRQAIADGWFSSHVHQRDYQVVFSDVYQPGEGEHKIMPTIRRLMEKHREGRSTQPPTFCVYSQDADLIVLMTQFFRYKNPILILRDARNADNETERRYMESGVFYLSVSKFVEELLSELRLTDLFEEVKKETGSELKNFGVTEILYDYIFLTFMAGNDFVQPIPYLRVRHGGIDRLVDLYRDLIMKYRQPLLLWQPDLHINMTLFMELVRGVAAMEDEEMKRLDNKRQRIFHYRPNRNQRDKLIKRELREDGKGRERETVDDGDKKDSGYVDDKIDKTDKFDENYRAEMALREHCFYYHPDHPLYEKYGKMIRLINYGGRHSEWKNQYYHHFFGIDKNNFPEYAKRRREICLDYVRSLIFTLKYYLCQVPSWSWCYDYRVAPLPTDILNTLENLDKHRNKKKKEETIQGLYEFEQDKPATPFEQLMMVIPPQNSKILPKPLAHLMTNPESSMMEWYPHEFELDVLAGEKHIYSEPLLPPCSLQELRRALGREGVISRLAERDMKRNRIQVAK